VGFQTGVRTVGLVERDEQPVVEGYLRIRNLPEDSVRLCEEEQDEQENDHFDCGSLLLFPLFCSLEAWRQVTKYSRDRRGY